MPAMRPDFHEVVWPRGRKMVARGQLAPRLPTLAGKTLGLLWDAVFRGDEIFPVIEAELARRFPGVRFVRWDAFGSIYGGEEAETVRRLPERLQALGIDAVVSAVGC